MAPITVTKAPVTVTATAQSKAFGTTLTDGPGRPRVSFTAVLSNSETIGTVTLDFGGGDVSTAPVGTYTITPSAATGGSGTEADYIFTYNTGVLTVTGGINIPPFSITSSTIQVISGVTNLVVCFPTVNGDHYDVLTSGNVAGPWAPVGNSTPPSPIVGDGNTDCVDIPIGGAGAGLFVLINERP